MSTRYSYPILYMDIASDVGGKQRAGDHQRRAFTHTEVRQKGVEGVGGWGFGCKVCDPRCVCRIASLEATN